MNALFYHRNALAYAAGDHRAWEGPDFDAWLQSTLKSLTEEYARLQPAA
jgi:hypothetical protein